MNPQSAMNTRHDFHKSGPRFNQRAAAILKGKQPKKGKENLCMS
jgi:hypothetical protein